MVKGFIVTAVFTAILLAGIIIYDKVKRNGK